MQDFYGKLVYPIRPENFSKNKTTSPEQNQGGLGKLRASSNPI